MPPNSRIGPGYDIPALILVNCKEWRETIYNVHEYAYMFICAYKNGTKANILNKEYRAQ